MVYWTPSKHEERAVSIAYVEGEYAIEGMALLVDEFLEDQSHHVLVVVGRTGIGKNTALRKLFRKKSLDVIEFPTVFAGSSLEASVEAYLLKQPNGVHYWKCERLATFRREGIVSLLRSIENQETGYRGKLIITAEPDDSADLEAVDIPHGIWITMDNKALLASIARTE